MLWILWNWILIQFGRRVRRHKRPARRFKMTGGVEVVEVDGHYYVLRGYRRTIAAEHLNYDQAFNVRSTDASAYDLADMVRQLREGNN